MNGRRLALLVVGLVAGVVAAASIASASPPPTANAGGMSGVVPPHGFGKPGNGQAGTPLLSYHGGPVMSSGSVVRTIFWGTKWATPSFVGDKITGLDAFYKGVGGTAYMGTNTEYTDGVGNVKTNVTYQGYVLDTSSSLSRTPKTSDILREVSKMITAPVTNGYYPVYVDLGRRSAGYCAWHSWGSINGVNVQFAFFFNLDGDAGCDPKDTTSGHSQGLAALANVSGHELSEFVTDPRGNGWYDSTGAENSDKCAWTFGSSLVKLGTSSWKIQGNWSNNAYNAGTGYTRGCIDGS